MSSQRNKKDNPERSVILAYTGMLAQASLIQVNSGSNDGKQARCFISDRSQ
jgi:hypothetical protein